MNMKLNKAEVLSDKQNEPTEESIKMFIGEDACERLSKIEEMLNNRYDVKRELRFWDSWQFGYWHKKKWLFDIIFKKNGLIVTMTITDKKVSEMERLQAELQPEIQEIWKKRKKFGPSSWPLLFEVKTEADISDLMKIVAIR